MPSSTKFPPLSEGELDALVIACGVAAADHRGGFHEARMQIPISRVAALINEVRTARDHRASAARVIGDQAMALEELRQRVRDLEAKGDSDAA